MIINEEIWQKLKGLYQSYPGIKYPDVTDEEILQAQAKMGVMFSDFYCYFLKHHTISLIGEWSIYQLNKRKGTPVTKRFVTRETKAFRKKLSTLSKNSKWCVIGGNQQGDLLAINQKGEIWTLQKGKAENMSRVATNFEQFLEQALVKVKSEDKDMSYA